MPSLSASSFTTTAPRIEISRVETEREIVGFGGTTGAGAAVPVEMTGLPGTICTCGRDTRIETDENPARSPPTRGAGGGTGFGGGATTGFFTGAGADAAGFFAAASFRADACSFFAVSFLAAWSFLADALFASRRSRSLPCR